MEMGTESRKSGLQSAISFLRGKIAVRREKLTADIERNIDLLIAEIRFCYQVFTYYTYHGGFRGRCHLTRWILYGKIRILQRSGNQTGHAQGVYRQIKEKKEEERAYCKLKKKITKGWKRGL